MNTLVIPASSDQASVMARLCIWLFLPLCAVAYQISAREVSTCSLDASTTGMWLGCVLHTPWLAALVVSDVGGFAAWMFVLGKMDLSAAFPMTALSYVLVIAVSWIVFSEPGGIVQVLGSASIMAGVFLMGRTGSGD